MEVWSLVRAHAEWITLFRETLYGRTALTPRMVADDKVCEVGQWLTQHEDALCHLREYRVARDIHAAFHRHTAYCLRLANSGHRMEALAETERNGELRRLSRHLVKAIQDLKRKVQLQRLEVRWDVASEATPLTSPAQGL